MFHVPKENLGKHDKKRNGIKTVLSKEMNRYSWFHSNRLSTWLGTGFIMHDLDRFYNIN